MDTPHSARSLAPVIRQTRKAPHHLVPNVNVHSRRGVVTITSLPPKVSHKHIFSNSVLPNFVVGSATEVAQEDDERSTTTNSNDDTSQRQPQNATKYAHWVAGYKNEIASFNSVATWAEMCIRTVVSQTAHEQQPSPLRAAICCSVLDQVTQVLGRFEDVMTLLKEELFGCIYYNYTKDVAADGIAHPEIVEQYHERRESFGLPPNTRALELCQRITFFQIARNMKNREQRLNRINPSKCIFRIIRKWHVLVRGLIFKSWRAYIRNLKIQAKKNEDEVMMAQDRRNALTVKSHFLGWRQYVKVSRAKRGVDPNSEIHKDIMIKAMTEKIRTLEYQLEEANVKIESLLRVNAPLRENVVKMISIVDKYRQRDASMASGMATPTPVEEEEDPEITRQRLFLEQMQRESEERRHLMEDPLPPDPPKTEEEILNEVHAALHAPKPKPLQFYETSGDGTHINNVNNTDPSSPKSNALSVTPHYRSVLDWVNIRINKVNGTQRRVRNLTTDFRDCEVYAALLNSLGTSKVIFEEIRRETENANRAKIVIRYASALTKKKLAAVVKPEDISSARGSNSKLLFALYEHFGGTTMTINCRLSEFLLKSFDENGALVVDDDSDEGEAENPDDHVKHAKLTNKDFIAWYNKLSCDPVYLQGQERETHFDERDFDVVDPKQQAENLNASRRHTSFLGDELLNASGVFTSFSSDQNYSSTQQHHHQASSVNQVADSRLQKMSHLERKDRISQADKYHPALVWFNKVLYQNHIIQAPVKTFEEAFHLGGHMLDFLEVLVPGSNMSELKSLREPELQAQCVEQTFYQMGIRCRCIPSINTANLELRKWKEVRQQYMLLLSALYARNCKVAFPLWAA